MSVEKLCLLCVDNLAVEMELDLNKFKPATQLLQQLFKTFKIKAVVHELCSRICEYCMADVLNMCETLRCWRDKQQKGKDKDDEDDADVAVEDAEMELELIGIGDAESEVDEADEEDQQQDAIELTTPSDNFSIAMAHDGVVLAKVVRDDSMRPQLMCCYCAKVFRGPSKILKHIELSQHQRTYCCRKCGSSFNSLDAIQQHKRIEQHERENSAYAKSVEFRCQECGRLFDRYFCLLRHENEVHREMEARFKCNECPMSFKYKSTFKLHTSRHLGNLDELKKYKCSYNDCSKSFVRRYQLTTHILSHSGVKSFPCEDCDKLFTNRGNLVVHRRTVHLGERRFECNTCLSRFTTKGILKKHQKSHSNSPKSKRVFLKALKTI